MRAKRSLVGVLLSAIGLFGLCTSFAFASGSVKLTQATNIPSVQYSQNPFNTDLQQNVTKGLPSEYTATSQTGPIALVMRIVQISFGFIGIGSIILMLYAGYLWMTSGGNDEQISKAKSLMKNGIIGLILITSAYSLTVFIVRTLFI